MIGVAAQVDYTEAIKVMEAVIDRMSGKGVGDLGRYMVGVLERESEQAFDEERNPSTGVRWPSWSQATESDRERRGYGDAMLHRTGRLREGVRAAWGVSMQLGGKLWALGLLDASQARKGKVLFYGASGRRKMPARPFMGLSASSIRSIEDYAAEVFAR